VTLTLSITVCRFSSFTDEFLFVLLSVSCGIIRTAVQCHELAWFRPSMSSVCAARCAHTKQIVVLCSWKRTPTPPLLGCHHHNKRQ